MGAIPVGKLTVEEYFALDDCSEGRLEYHDGETFPVVAATEQQARIQANATIGMGNRLRGSSCHIAGQLRIRTTARNYVVPDITVICGAFMRAAESKDAFTNPKVIVEILSPSTADFDHGGKFALYRELPSLLDYILVSQDAPRVEVFHKQSDEKWLLSIYPGMDSIVRIESLDLELPAAEIYAGVEFDAEN